MPEEMTYRELMSQGEHFRENKGDSKGALEWFEKAYRLAQTALEKGDAQSQIGLTHWHLGNMEEAGRIFQELITFGEETDEPRLQALGHRNLARPELTPDPKQARLHAKEGYELAVESGSIDDLSWFVHGLFSTALNDGDREEAWETLEFERRKVEEFEASKDPADVPNNVFFVWKTGYLMDLAVFTGKPEPLEEALKIAEMANLPLRVSRIKTMLEVMYAAPTE